MNRHTGQTSPQSDTHSDELQLAIIKQQNRCLKPDMKPFKITKFQNADELNLLLSTTAKNSLFSHTRTASSFSSRKGCISLSISLSFIFNRNLWNSTHKRHNCFHL